MKKFFCSVLLAALLLTPIPVQSKRSATQYGVAAAAAVTAAALVNSIYNRHQAEKADAALSAKLSSQNFNFDEIKFPKNFLWGSATCEYQNSGRDNIINFPGVQGRETNWTHWELKTDGITGNQKSGISADHCNRIEQDVALMKKMGMNSYRFSVAWNFICPKGLGTDGKIIVNQAGLDHYHRLCDELIKNDIEPMLSLHHFTHPEWFEKMGAFEKAENIGVFVQFCMIVFNSLKDKVKLWCTINEPTCYMLMGYVLGKFPPGKNNPRLAGIVLKNMLIAHCAVYDAIKNAPGGKEAQVGIVHSLLKFQAYHWWSPFERPVSSYFTHIVHEALFNFFKTGQFTFRYALVPGLSINYYNKDAKHKNDFFGLNYYSRALISGYAGLLPNLDATSYPGEIMTDMPYAMYAQGFYDAIKEISTLGLPIYITENGIADRKDDRRSRFIVDYVTMMSKAIQDGCDVRGYYYWTLTDNFEWDQGYSTPFGLYQVDFRTQERTLREGSKRLAEVIAFSKTSVDSKADSDEPEITEVVAAT